MEEVTEPILALSEAKVTQSRLTLCEPMDYNPCQLLLRVFYVVPYVCQSLFFGM